MRTNGLYLAASTLGLLTILTGWFFWNVATMSGPGSEFIALSGISIILLGVLLFLGALDVLVFVLIIIDRTQKKLHPEKRQDKTVILS